MSALQLSPEFSFYFTQRLLHIQHSPGYQGYANGVFAASIPFMPAFMGENVGNDSAGILIMSGTMPSDINTVTSYSAISPNILVSFGLWAALKNGGTTQVGRTVTFNSIYVNAIESGTATWFLCYSRGYSPNNPLSDTIVQGCMGTIGITASGADFEIPSTTVTTGSPYKLSNFRLTFPSSWDLPI